MSGRALLILCLIGGILTLACDKGRPEIAFQNRTGEPVIVYEVVDGKEIKANRVETAYGTTFLGTCTRGPLVVRTLDGELVATSPRLCRSTEWEITWGSKGPSATGTLPPQPEGE